MQSRRFNRPLLRGTAAALVGLVSLLAACESRMPTATDVARMDATSVERAAPTIGVVPDSSVAWMVDGVASASTAAKQIPADSILSVQVLKANGHAEIHLITRRGQRLGGDVVLQKRAGVALDKPITTPDVNLVSKSAGTDPLVIIDGMPSTTAALRKLSADRIQSVEVVKGQRAADLYGDAAKSGAILVTTKSQ